MGSSACSRPVRTTGFCDYVLSCPLRAAIGGPGQSCPVWTGVCHPCSAQLPDRWYSPVSKACICPCCVQSLQHCRLAAVKQHEHAAFGGFGVYASPDAASGVLCFCGMPSWGCSLCAPEMCGSAAASSDVPGQNLLGWPDHCSSQLCYPGQPLPITMLKQQSTYSSSHGCKYNTEYVSNHELLRSIPCLAADGPTPRCSAPTVSASS